MLSIHPSIDVNVPQNWQVCSRNKRNLREKIREWPINGTIAPAQPKHLVFIHDYTGGSSLLCLRHIITAGGECQADKGEKVVKSLEEELLNARAYRIQGKERLAG